MARQRRQPTLSDSDKRVLDFEREWGQSPHSITLKMQEMAIHLHMSVQGYNLVLTSLVDDPLAEEYDPETIAALREVRRAHRSSESALWDVAAWHPWQSPPRA